tara:strand:+ start:3 stop:2417 length:2415 start_codon:yes stop_codon:yes gene_type:complete
METVNKDAKSLLAKMLATENIHVVHKKMPTAYFDTKNRELGLPILKEMNGDIYDLMCLHEVGHALWTDNDEWMDIVKKKTDDDVPKSFINVTEDVRIERKIKSKYPGGVKSFLRGYSKLYKDDFFGTANMDYETMNLADKINLHAKVGSLTGITFNEEETEIYDLCKSAVTFKDAVEAAKALYAYCKEHNEDTDCMSDDHDMMGQEWEESEDGEEREFEMSSFEGEETDGEDSEKDECEAPVDSCKDGESGSGDEEGKEEENASGNSDAEGEGKKTDETANTGGTGGMGEMTNPIQAETVLNWEQNKEDLNDDTGRDYFYLNIPESNLDTSIINYKRCMETLKDWYYVSGMVHGSHYRNDLEAAKVQYEKAWMESAYQYATKIEKDSMKTVNYLVKEFEMKKSADSYQRASVAKTGVLDMLKMHSYKYNEDVFKRITVEPDGKNHGLVMFLDWSASMAHQIHDCYKQLLQIVWFCKRVGIKFEVYAFSDSAWEGFKEIEKNASGQYADSPTWNYKHGDLHLGNHLLLNIFSSRMSKMELKTMVHYLTMVTYSITYQYAHHWNMDFNNSEILKNIPTEFNDFKKYNGVLSIPYGWNLGGTPLNGAIVNAMNFIPKYREKNGIQNLNIVFITDGASNDNSNCRMNFSDDTKYDQTEYCRDGKKVYYDPITKKQYLRNQYGRNNQVTTTVMLNMLKDRTKCNVVGFFLAQSSGNGRVSNRDIQYMFPNQDINGLRKILRKDKVLTCESMGYDEYYLVAGGKSLAIDDGELAVNSEMTRGKMAKGFANYMKGKLVNRVLLNKFVDQIA